MNAAEKESKRLRELNERYDMSKIPLWLIDKKVHGYLSFSACLFAINDETACFTQETDKAVLFEWHNRSLEACKSSGGEFWVPKSLVKAR